jgi:hypothetical protein
MISKKLSKSIVAGLLSVAFVCLMAMPRAHSQIAKQPSLSNAGQAYIKVTSPRAREVWEKGTKYPIRWESQGVRADVKILLIRESVRASQTTKEIGAAPAVKSVKPIEIVKDTPNSGSYDYTVPNDLPDGIYKVQVATIDMSVKGTSEGTVAIGTKNPIGDKMLRFGDRRKGNEKVEAPPAGTAQSAGKAQTAGATASTGPTPSAGATASKATPKATIPSVAVAGKSQAAAVKVVKVQVNPVKVSEAELKNLPALKAAATGTNLKFGGHSTSGRKIVVTAPKDGDIWEADKEYTITWDSTGITGDVKIDVAANQYQLHPITGGTANSGAYLFRVPRNFVGDYRVWRVRVSTLDGTIYGWSPPSFILYSQDVDLQCQIYDPKICTPSGWYKRNAEERWLQFNVWIRNDGIRHPISVDKVLVQLIKEPDEIVCYQEEWGIGGIYPHEWYKLPDPRKIELRPINHDSRRNKGVYRLEVWLDPENRLGELEGLQHDNKAVLKWTID